MDKPQLTIFKMHREEVAAKHGLLINCCWLFGPSSPRRVFQSVQSAVYKGWDKDWALLPW